MQVNDDGVLEWVGSATTSPAERELLTGIAEPTPPNANEAAQAQRHPLTVIRFGGCRRSCSAGFRGVRSRSGKFSVLSG